MKKSIVICESAICFVLETITEANKTFTSIIWLIVFAWSKHLLEFGCVRLQNWLSSIYPMFDLFLFVLLGSVDKCCAQYHMTAICF